MNRPRVLFFFVPARRAGIFSSLLCLRLLTSQFSSLWAICQASFRGGAVASYIREDGRNVDGLLDSVAIEMRYVSFVFRDAHPF